MEIMKPEIISRQTIKPSSPTPDSKKIYMLSLLDLLIANRIYVPIIFFYQNKEGDNSVDVAHISSGLKKSLSETLTHYYPLAGRIKDGVTVECNDEGAYFSEARIDCHLEGFVKHPEARDYLDLLMPVEIQSNSSDMGSLLLIQITFFSCGGIAIGMRVSHKVSDLHGISAFLNDWATMARKSGEEISAELTPFFPPGDSLSMPEAKLYKGSLVKKRFVFEAVKLGALKAMATQSGVENPTRVEVVAALIYRCAVAASKVSSGSLKPSVLLQTVNMRKRIVPPLPEKSFGNMVWFYSIHTARESEIEFHALVGQLKAGLAHFCDTYGKIFTGQELIRLMFKERAKFTHSNDNHHVNKYICTSWCRTSLYQTDFGWGKPIWLSPTGIGSKNIICLTDTREGDGIEAFVTLEKQEMAVFERDEELLQFSSLN
ncbi:stemmadenine O-acetyltransferase-like [Vitis riparia]|uniref:stemmadenine O-acetyltransferase-like n=1 Tax=Vitis riparia TaxID=96939 RepID=UPI00155A2C3B|nr:stemmadenine O-acetyltransferase-like [Vitis riparia]